MTRPAEIMLVTGTMRLGGTELHLARIAPALVARGWRVSLFSLAGDGPLSAEFARGGVEILRPPVARGGGPASLPVRIAKLAIAAAALFLAMLLRRPAIIHFFLPAAYVTGAPLALLARAPVRLMSRRSLNNYQSDQRLLARLEALLHPRMTAVLGNSRAVTRQLAQEGIPASRLGLIYSGIDVAPFASPNRTALRAGIDIGPDALVFIVVANLIPYKGHRALINAFGMASSRLPTGWRLLVVGRDDGIGGTLRDQVASLGLPENILFLGERLDVPAFLCSADIGLLASHQEGFSNAILEGMAVGLPMIVTDVGGNREAITDGESGLVVPPNDPESLVRAVLRLAGDPDLRTRLGRAAQRRVETQFSLDHCVAEYDALYRALLHNGKLPAELLADATSRN